MSLSNDFFYVVGFALVSLAIILLVYPLAKSPPAVAPKTGSRGLKRARALEGGGSFKQVEPLMRLVASWITPMPLVKTRQKIDRQLVLAGDWLGLTADEFLALSALSCLLFAAIGLGGTALIEMSPIFTFFVAGVGAMLPYMRATGEMQDRFKQINRALPGAIDLAALCMGAGLDFPGALRQIVDKSATKDSALKGEVERILQELELGRTRKQALDNMADRVPTEAVQDFVGSVVQAEEKGNPLAEVLRVQARMLRLRRSVMAEEAAARAAVQMMGPLLLIFCSIILLLMGPFVIQGLQSGF